jgi:Transposase IS116/IS110/IS902 family./Transposase.
MSSLSKINPNCAGIDIGNESVFVGIEDCDVTSFGTFTDDYINLIAFLKEHNITTVVMEATGVYWITLFEMLEAAGISVTLVNGKQVKYLPGRKSDVADCQWLQQLHSFGLLRPCFIPDDITRTLRTYTRLRADHLSLASSHIQHMHKALTLMNIKVQNVISQLHGVSGMRIMTAIVLGERNPERLADLCEKSILKTKRERVVASLKGNYKSEHIFALKQALCAYDFYQNQITECDKQIEALLNDHTDTMPPPTNLTSPKSIRHNPPQIDALHTKLMKMTGGNDPSQITGLTDKTLLELIAETGTDLQKHWMTEKHFSSWVALSPSMHQSGKTNKRRKIKKNSRAGQIFREAALSIAASKHSALSAFYKRMKAKKGFLHALKATARKIAVIYYRIMTKGLAFVEHGIQLYQQNLKEQQLRFLRKKARSLGLLLVPG